MINEIKHKTNMIDWLGCIPIIGTAVGLVEMIYYMFFKTITVTPSKEEIQANSTMADCKFKIARHYTEAAIRIRKSARDSHSDMNEASQRSQRFVDISEQLDKEGGQLLGQAQKRQEKYDAMRKKIDTKAFLGLLRATWIGGIGILAYKLLKKYPSPTSQSALPV